MPDTPAKILITGATGYIGGSVVSNLLTSPDPKIQKCSLTVIIRGAEKAKQFESKGVSTVQFKDLEDVDALRAAASNVDIVLNCATGFATNAARALIEGLAERKKQGQAKVLFVQLSGTSNVGDFPISKTYVEPRYPSSPFIDTEDLASHLRTRDAAQPYPQRTSDIVTIDTGAALSVPTIILMPPTIYGKGSGFFNKRSMQVPAMCRAALASKQAIVLGDGAGVMDHVHVLDLAMLFEKVVQTQLAEPDVKFDTGSKGIYFCETGHHSWREMAEGIGRTGKEMGLLETSEVKSVGLEEAARLMAGNVLQPEHIEAGFALNAISKTHKAFEFGWEPRFTREDFFASFRDELGVAHGDHE